VRKQAVSLLVSLVKINFTVVATGLPWWKTPPSIFQPIYCIVIIIVIFTTTMTAQHPSKDVANIQGQFPDQEFLAANHIFEWFTEEAESPFLKEYCVSVSNRCPTKCTCLLPVLNTCGQNDSRTLREVSAFVVRFSCMSHEDCIRVFMGWKKYADIIEKAANTKQSYCLPLVLIESDDGLLNPDNGMMICSNAMLAILGKGRKFWKVCRNAVITNEVPCHGLKGKVSNNVMDPELSLFLSLPFFFEEMEELAEPRATRLVREETNNGIRNDNETLDLPAWTTKRELYHQ